MTAWKARTPAKPDHQEQASAWLESFALALASGVLLAVPFLKVELAFLHFVALVPWVWLLTRPNTKGVWIASWVASGGYFGMAFGPFSALSPVIPLAIALGIGPLMLPFAFAVRTLYLRWQWPLVFLVPIAWTANEWARLQFSVGRVLLFPINSSQYEFVSLIQISDLTGAAGVTFMVTASSGALTDALLQRSKGFRALRSLVGYFALLGCVLAYGYYRIETFPELRDGPRIAVIQPDELHYRDEKLARTLFDTQDRFTRDRVLRGQADLIAWPENSIDYPFESDPYYYEGLVRLAHDRDAAILAGAFSWELPKRLRVYTSAFFVSADGQRVRRYNKIYLIPWAETLPFPGLRQSHPSLHRFHERFAEKVVGYPAKGAPGDKLILFPLASAGREYRFATPICYESGSSDFTRRAVAKGADFLVNISSEGLFGAPIYNHMWGLGILRVVESRLPMARSGNHGISGFVDPLGRTQSVVRGEATGRLFRDKGVLVDRIRLPPEPIQTIYARIGDAFSYLCILLTVVLTLLALKDRP